MVRDNISKRYANLSQENLDSLLQQALKKNEPFGPANDSEKREILISPNGEIVIDGVVLSTKTDASGVETGEVLFIDSKSPGDDFGYEYQISRDSKKRPFKISVKKIGYVRSPAIRPVNCRFLR